jgi:hypothetical protein
MQNPTDEAEASVPTVTVREGPHLNPMGIFTVRRKAAKRSERWYQNIAAPLSTPARKKSRLNESLPTTIDNATGTREISVGLLFPTTDIDAGAARATGRWTPEEDVELTSAVAKMNKKWWGREHRIDWVAVAALVTGRTNDQCHQRWKNTLDPSIVLTAGRKGKWTEDEDLKLKYSVHMYGGKDWVAIATLVSGRTNIQCWNRWYDVLKSSVDRAHGRTGKWTKDEDLKLKYSVQMHGGKDWVAIAALVSSRTKKQCHRRWKYTLDPSIAPTAGRTCKFTEDEDLKLKNAVQAHGGNHWGKIAALVPGRTKAQCSSRWYYCQR